ATSVPHLSAVADHGGHRGVDDDVAGNVEVGDSAVGVHHGHAGAALVHRADVLLDGGALRFGQRGDLSHHVAESIVRIHAEALQYFTVLLEYVPEEDADGVAEDDGIGYLHHRRLQVQGEEDSLLAGLRHLLLQELDE